MDLSWRGSLNQSVRNTCGFSLFSEGLAGNEWQDRMARFLIQRLSPTCHSREYNDLQWKVLLPLSAQFLLPFPAFPKNLSSLLKGNTALLVKSSMSSHKMTSRGKQRERQNGAILPCKHYSRDIVQHAVQERHVPQEHQEGEWRSYETGGMWREHSESWLRGPFIPLKLGLHSLWYSMHCNTNRNSK